MERPYLDESGDRVRDLIHEHWDDFGELGQLAYELQFRKAIEVDQRAAVIERLVELGIRSEVDPNDKAAFKFPSAEVIQKRQLALKGLGRVDWRRYGLLSLSGYRVGKTKGKPKADRQRILNWLFLKDDLRDIDDLAYAAEWGGPKSKARLRMMANTLASFVRKAKRHDAEKMRVAIDEWTEDLQYLKATFYDGPNAFPWPDLDPPPETASSGGQDEGGPDRSAPEFVVMTLVGPGGMAGGLTASTWGYVAIPLTPQLLKHLEEAYLHREPRPLPGVQYVRHERVPRGQPGSWIRNLGIDGMSLISAEDWASVTGPDVFNFMARPKREASMPMLRRGDLVIEPEEGRNIEPWIPHAPMPAVDLAAMTFHQAMRSDNSRDMRRLFESERWRRPLREMLNGTRRQARMPRFTPTAPPSGPGLEAVKDSIQDEETRSLLQEAIELLADGQAEP